MHQFSNLRIVMTQDELKFAGSLRSGLCGRWRNHRCGHRAHCQLFYRRAWQIKHRIKAAVASSEATAARLKSHGIQVLDLNQIDSVIPVYIDGADEITPQGAMIKGGGGALTREKIIASASSKFVCIADSSKLVNMLGNYPLPVEVIPMSHALVTRKLAALGGKPHLRMNKDKNEPFHTDNGNMIIDVAGLAIADPVMLESQINNIVGVVTVGLFARQGLMFACWEQAPGSMSWFLTADL